MSNQESNILTEEEVREVLQDILNEEELHTIKTSSGSKKCDGYCSFMTRVDTKNHQLIIKHAPTSKKLRQYISFETFYEREIYYYNIIAPAFQKLTNFTNNSYLVKCYKTSCDIHKELLVMANLSTQGFELCDRSEFLDEAHVVLVLKEYGKMHANSFIMQMKDLEGYNAITKDLHNVFNRECIGGVYDAFFAASRRVIDLFELGSEIYEKMQQFLDNYEQWFHLKDTKQDRSVVLHGDCWTNNIMFKYNNSIPVELRFVDYQLMCTGTPVFDLSQFIYVCCSKNIYDNLEYYLKIYHDSLSSAMHTLGCSSSDIYTFEMLQDDWKKFGKFGFSLCMLFIKANLAKEFRDINDLAEVGDSYEADFKKEGPNEELINRRIRDVCVHMFENQLI